MERVRKHKKVKLITREMEINYVASDKNLHTRKILTETLLAIEMRKTQILKK